MIDSQKLSQLLVPEEESKPIDTPEIKENDKLEAIDDSQVEDSDSDYESYIPRRKSGVSILGIQIVLCLAIIIGFFLAKTYYPEIYTEFLGYFNTMFII